MKTLFEGIYTQFKASDALEASVTGLYNTKAKPNATFPYIVYSLVSAVTDWDMGNNTYKDVMIQFNIFSDTPSSEEARDIFDLLEGDVDAGTGFNFFNLSVDNYNTLIMSPDTAILTQVDKIWQYNVTYNVLLNKTGVNVTERFYGNLYNLMGI